MADVRPPIPVRLADRPTTGGLVKPWVNVELADGGLDFRRTNGTRWRQAWTEGLCQVCGQMLTIPVVFLAGPEQLTEDRSGMAEERYVEEAPLHPECAAYVTKACPMVAGRMARFRSGPSLTEGSRGRDCGKPGCNCGGYRDTDQVLHGDGYVTVQRAASADETTGRPAHPWFLVFARDYALAQSPEGRLLGGIPLGVVRVRQVSDPGLRDRERATRG